MSKYTTGELAKLCGVSVRTVQYYDSRGILTPSALSEGGRRLYSDEDLNKMKIICFLRELDLPLGSIAELFSEPDPGSVVDILLQQQQESLRQEISEKQSRLQKLEQLRRALRNVTDFSLRSIGDIAHIMQNRKKLRKLHLFLVLGVLQWAGIILWAAKGIWWLFALWAVIAIPYGVWISMYYFRRVVYICPQCHTVFRPRMKEAFFARHTPTARKLTCPACCHKGFCVETYGEKPVVSGGDV